jgi:hypothetical protein
MRAYIHSMRGEPWNEECATAQRGFEELGIQCVPFSSNDVLDQGRREDVVVGGLLVTGHALAMRGVKPPSIDYPKSLSRFLGRRVWATTVGKIKAADLPLFVKPLEEKELPGTVAWHMTDLGDYLARGEGYPVLCSEPVRFVSEKRFFIRYGQLADMRHYRGDPGIQCDDAVVNDTIETYAADPNEPAGCSIDLGVTDDGRTLLVEVNDGYALGCYGADCVAYALLLAARWAELVGVEDELAGLDLRGLPRERKITLGNKQLSELLMAPPGATPGFVSYAHAVAEWQGVENDLMALLEHRRASTGEVWRWLANRQGATEEVGPDGKGYLFLRAARTRIAVRLDAAEPVGVCSLKRYDRSSGVVVPWLEGLPTADTTSTWLLKSLIGLCEHDAKESGLKSVFALADDSDELPDEDFYRSMGYAKVADKDDTVLGRVLGANVTYDCTMEKRLR